MGPRNESLESVIVTQPVMRSVMLCHSEQAFFAQCGIWASRALRRVLCLQRFTTTSSASPAPHLRPAPAAPKSPARLQCRSHLSATSPKHQTPARTLAPERPAAKAIPVPSSSARLASSATAAHFASPPPAQPFPRPALPACLPGPTLNRNAAPLPPPFPTAAAPAPARAALRAPADT